MNGRQRSILTAIFPALAIGMSVLVLAHGRPDLGIQVARGADGLVRIVDVTARGPADRDGLRTGIRARGRRGTPLVR
jgi:hypothetical protein